MTTVTWRHDDDPTAQLGDLINAAREIGILVVQLSGGSPEGSLSWDRILPWTRARAVTVADVSGKLAGTGLDVALCSDLIYIRDGSSLDLPGGAEPPTEAQTWALARAGRAALARGLLGGGPIDPAEAVRVGLAHAVVPTGDPLPVPDQLSLAALTGARDLMRCRAGGSAGRALELATFRLLFAVGDPVEGAQAFLEKRPPLFNR
jgi:enoyl-CoA hydratase/carnithine racemase